MGKLKLKKAPSNSSPDNIDRVIRQVYDDINELVKCPCIVIAEPESTNVNLPNEPVEVDSPRKSPLELIEP